jgi:hypothetical protein
MGSLPGNASNVVSVSGRLLSTPPNPTVNWKHRVEHHLVGLPANRLRETGGPRSRYSFRQMLRNMAGTSIGFARNRSKLNH